MFFVKRKQQSIENFAAVDVVVEAVAEAVIEAVVDVVVEAVVEGVETFANGLALLDTFD